MNACHIDTTDQIIEDVNLLNGTYLTQDATPALIGWFSVTLNAGAQRNLWKYQNLRTLTKEDSTYSVGITRLLTQDPEFVWVPETFDNPIRGILHRICQAN